MSTNLNPEEVDALMDAIREGRVPTEPPSSSVQATAYDLTSRDRVLRGQMPALDSIHERIAAALATGLSGRTRLPLRVEPSPGTLVPLADLTLLLAPPATLCIINLGLGGAEAVVILDPGLAETLVAAALGDRNPGDGAKDAPELTPVGRMVLRKLLGILATAMGQAWQPYLPMTPEVVRFEADPRLAVSIAPGGDVAVLTSFGVTGPITGRIQLAIPYTAIQSAKKLLGRGVFSRTGGDPRVRDAIAHELAASRVELRAILGRTSLTLSRLLELSPGDVLALDTDESSPLPLLVEGREKLTGMPLVSHGSLAMKLERGLRPTLTPLPVAAIPPLPAGAAPAQETK